MEEPYDPLTHDAALLSVVERVPRFAQATHLQALTLPGGLSNANYVVNADGTRYVVRVTGANADLLGIDRWREGVAILRAAAAGIAPQPVEFLLPEGHMVTRYLTEARPLTMEEFTSEPWIPRIARRLGDIHRLEPIDGTFSPYADISRWLALLDDQGATRPLELTSLLEQVAATEQTRRGVFEPVLCHNDPFYLNFLDDGSLWVLDWEYAGMGDPMYDLAGAAYPQTPAGRDLLLETYFGVVDDDSRLALDRLIGVYLCWNIVWCLVQAEDGTVDHDYLGFARELLEMVPAVD